MGAISFSLDLDLLEELQRLLPLDLFIETGTFRGETLAAVHGRFKTCISVELSPEYHAAAARRFAGLPGIQVKLGNSPEVLRGLRSDFTGRSTFFWLDAHWCAAAGTAGLVSQCPLLEELRAIGSLNGDSVLLIDDARLFLGPPPKPHEISAWPDFDAILRELRRLSEQHALVYFNDVLAFVPGRILATLKPFLQAKTYNLLTYADKARDYDSVLGQATRKDEEIRQLASEIEMLRRTAAERLETIQKLDVAVEQTRRLLEAASAGKAGGAFDMSALVEEVGSLRIQLQEARDRLRERQVRLQKLELQNAGHVARKGARSAWRRWLTQWQAHLAANTSCPLSKLQQYPPRPLRPEKFPRVARLHPWPRICLATPSFQQARFLERTMLSVLDQQYPNLAYGVQDGGSTDGSADIITRHLARLAHAESAPDQGQSDAIRRCFQKLYPTRHDLMGWLNSDDLLMPGALHYVGAYFARHPEVDVVYGHRVIIDEDDKEIGRWYLPRYSKHTLPWFDLVPQETLFWRARCLDLVGGMDPEFHFALDWDLLLRFEEAGLTIRRLPFFLGCFRMHTQQKTSANISTVGEDEMRKLRRRTHGREVHPAEVQKHLEEEIRQSALVEWLHRRGIRW